MKLSLIAFIVPVESQNCPVPIPLNITNISTESALVSWFQSGSPDSFDISIRTVPGSYPSQPQFTGISSSPFEITGLESGVLYEFRIRSNCDNELSNWSQARRFITLLSNPSICSLKLPLGDNNCGGPGDLFRISVNEAPGDSLGKDVFIDKINLIIEHTWPADLNVRLKSPSGQEITLTSDNGIGGNHYGNPVDTLCLDLTSFSDKACKNISDASPPFIGIFRPEMPFSKLEDGSTPLGIWELLICDKAPGDIGTLIYFEIEFEQIRCLPPESEDLKIIGNNDLQIILNSNQICDSIIVEIGPQGFIPEGVSGSVGQNVTLFSFSCNSDTLLLTGLEANTLYDFYLYSICDSTKSINSCGGNFSTFCPAPILQSDFDSEEICSTVCNEFCTLNGWWKNHLSSDAFWQINSGPTPTEGTGPETAEKGMNYLFFNGSSPLCNYPAKAILESVCLEILSSDDDCDMAFSYHMWGPQVNQLKLLLSLDGGFMWDTLWSETGSQSNTWLQADIDLSHYHGHTGRFRFVAYGSFDGPGDIALDNIRLFHSLIADSSALFYFVDMDGDGYGIDGTETFFCTNSPPDGWADKGGDCDDENPNINPGAEEIPCNLIDENCNGLEDDQPIDNPIVHQLITLIHESCSRASDGSIELSISGGTPPYIVNWNTGDTTLLINELSQGIYYAIIEDAESCLYRTAFFEIRTENIADLIFTDVVRPSCTSFSDGSLKVQVGGGFPPFSYEWNNGSDSSFIDNIPTGDYQVTVTDANNCIYTSDIFSLRPLNPFEIQVTEKRQPLCYGDGNGSISVLIIGGIPPYNYSWSHGDSLPNTHDLASGYFRLTVTDQSDCQVIKDSIFLDQPKALQTIYPIISPPICPGRSTARVFTEIQGGTFPFTFFWQKGNQTYNTKDLINVAAGKYNLTVTDFNGCTFNDLLIIDQPDSFFTEIKEIIPVSCGTREDGYLEISVHGGWPPYELFWSNGIVNEQHLSGLAPGYYQFTLSDQAGCKFSSAEFFVENKKIPLEIELTVIDSISCFEAGNGRLKGEVTSDYGPFIFDWNHLNPLISDSNYHLIENVVPNNYLLTVTDATNCKGTSSPLLLTEPADLIISDIASKMPTCFGDSNGVLLPVFTGGSAPYSFEWSNGSIQDSASNLTSGLYHLTITDRNNCSRIRSNIFLAQPLPLEIVFEIIASREGKNEGEVHLQIQGGVPPYQIDWDEKITRFSNDKATELNPGKYHLILSDENGCIVDTSFIIDLITQSFLYDDDLLTLFPNPTNSHIYLKNINEQSVLKNYSIRLMDKAGKHHGTLESELITDHIRKIKIPENLANGFYLLELEDKLSGYKSIHRFLYQRP